MNRNRLSLGWALLALTLHGCGGGAAGYDEVVRYCSESCAAKVRCGSAKPDCQADCEKRLATAYASYREEYFVAVTECVQGSPCGLPDDYCHEAALQRIAPNPAANPVYQQCLAARAMCKAADQPTFSDDYCPLAVALTDDASDFAAACYRRPCAEMSGCLKVIFD